MVPTWHQQALIEAPIDEVWDLVSDPNRFPEWNPTAEVTGVPTEIETGSTYQRTAPLPLGRHLKGPRMTTNLVDCAPEDASIGMRVEVAFGELHDGLRLPFFRPAA